MSENRAHTRERILDAAERLFDEFGLEATSTRQIATEAGANSAAPNFHFGSKSNLIREVFLRRMQPLVAERLAALRAAEANGSASIEAIVDSFIDPLVVLRKKPDENRQSFLRLLARTSVAPCAEFTELLETELEDYTSEYARALAEALPQLGETEINMRFDLAVGAIARAHSHSGGLGKKRSVETLKRFVVAGQRGAGPPRDQHLYPHRHVAGWLSRGSRSCV